MKHKGLYGSKLYWKTTILISAITGSISITAFGSLFVIPIGVEISAVGLKVFEITSVIKKYNWIN